MATKYRLVDMEKDELIKTFNTVEDIIDYYKVPKQVIVDGINNRSFFGRNKKILKDSTYDFESKPHIEENVIGGLNITEILTVLDMQVSEFANKIGVSKCSVNKWKNNDSTISKPNRKAIKNLLERNGING